ncbi:MAG: FGGY-family carbohydrate kinase [Pseudomonadota bacterium]|nr:FGGY-family carbohydrate kinase [Pseudomonadota bacterium]
MYHSNINSHSYSPQIILGVDIGTSGVRGCIVEVKTDQRVSDRKLTETILVEHTVPMVFPDKDPASGASTQDPAVWTHAFEQLFLELAGSVFLKQVTHIVADATSSTVLLCDSDGKALTNALMYDDQQAKEPAKAVQELVTQDGFETAATGASSTLAKVLLLRGQLQESKPSLKEAVICHQIDWFNHWLTGKLAITDENSALKLGYDSVNNQWPIWIIDLLATKSNSTGLVTSLPTVLKPGTPIAAVSHEMVSRFGLSKSTVVHAGTTDSIAGFLASGASKIGDAVSSLGSTLAVKLVSKKPVFNIDYGIYSHRLGDNWLVGGASNAGGAVLLHFFPLEKIKTLLAELLKPGCIDRWQPRSLPDYYPLIKAGERFPVADAHLKPKLPVFEKDADHKQQREFLLAMIQGLTQIEKLGYQRLEELGANSVQRLFTVGGGTKNRVWQALRQQHLNTQFTEPDSLDAAFGVTRLVSQFYKP